MFYSKLENKKCRQVVTELVTKQRSEQNSLEAVAERHQRRGISDRNYRDYITVSIFIYNDIVHKVHRTNKQKKLKNYLCDS